MASFQDELAAVQAETAARVDAAHGRLTAVLAGAGLDAPPPHQRWIGGVAEYLGGVLAHTPPGNLPLARVYIPEGRLDLFRQCVEAWGCELYGASEHKRPMDRPWVGYRAVTFVV